MAILVGIELFIYSSNEHKTEDENFQDKFNEDYRVYSIVIPDNLNFCGEKVPIDDEDVRERMDRELLINTYWQSNSMLYHKRANKWFPVIEPILKQNGVPDDFKYLCLVESGLMNMVSSSGATGFWQMLEATGKSYGLEINAEVDERYHVARSTVAACNYLKEAHAKYGNWTLAAASYNMGMSGVDRQLKRQDATYYYDLLLNEETSRYVFRVLAAKTIMENPTKYGFHYRQKDLYAPHQTTTIKVDSAITDLARFAKEHNTNYKILKIFNPWLRESFLTNKTGKTYDIHLPKAGYRDFRSTEADLMPKIQNSVADSLKPAGGNE